MNTELVQPLDPGDGVTQCSFTESLFCRFVTPSMLFCFRERIDPARLKQALARVLSDYGVYAGRLTRHQGAVCIEHGRGGAQFELTERAEWSREFGTTAIYAKDLRRACPYIPMWQVVRGQPLFAARLTQTLDGSVLGITWHHIVGDVYSTMLFMRAWAHAYRGRPYQKPLEVHDRDAFLSQHLPQRGEHERRLRLISWREYLQLVRYLIAHRGQRVDLQFSRADVAALHAAAQRVRPVSRHDALCAHVFSLIRNVQGKQPGTQLSLAVNCRKPFGLPSNLLGNTLDMVTAPVGPDDDIATIAASLRTRIEAVSSGPTLHGEAMKIKAERRSIFELMRYIDTRLDPRRGNLFLSNTVSSGIYDLVFESTPPLLVHGRPMQMTPAGWFGIMSESPIDGVLTVRLWLPAEFAVRLKQEAARVPRSTRSNLEREKGEAPIASGA